MSRTGLPRNVQNDAAAATIPPTPARASSPALSALPLWLPIGAVLYLLLMVAGAKLLNDPDTYWHIFVGNWILSHGLPYADPFSFTFAGKPWIAKEWLSQLILAASSNIGGWTLVVAVSASAATAAFGLVTRFLSERLAPVPTLAFVAAAFVISAPHLLARPHVLALPVMVAWVAGLVGAVERGTRPPLALLLVMILWANMHASFPLGILLVGAFGLDAIASAPAAERFQIARDWVLFGLLSVIAGLATPYGPQAMAVTFQILNLGAALPIINEWQPPDFSHIGGLEVVLLGGLGLALWQGFTLRWPRVLTLLGLVHLALSATRNGEILGLLAPLVLAAPVARQFAATRAPDAVPTATTTVAPIAVTVALALATFAFGAVLHYAPASNISPAAALAALNEAKAERVFNDYPFGGFIIAAGAAPFIDGRTELYGGAFTARHDAAVNLDNLSDFLAMLDSYAIDATLLAPQRPAVALLDRLPGWKRLYSDNVAVVHVRTTEA